MSEAQMPTGDPDFGAHDDEEQSFAPPPHWRKQAAEMRKAFLKGQVPLSPAEVTILYVAILLSSTLYLAGVFVAALAWGNHTAAVAAIATAGICYLAYAAQILRPNPIGAALVAWSVVTGIFAGVALIW